MAPIIKFSGYHRRKYPWLWFFVPYMCLLDGIIGIISLGFLSSGFAIGYVCFISRYTVQQEMKHK